MNHFFCVHWIQPYVSIKLSVTVTIMFVMLFVFVMFLMIMFFMIMFFMFFKNIFFICKISKISSSAKSAKSPLAITAFADHPRAAGALGTLPDLRAAIKGPRDQPRLP